MLIKWEDYTEDLWDNKRYGAFTDYLDQSLEEHGEAVIIAISVGVALGTFPEDTLGEIAEWMSDVSDPRYESSLLSVFYKFLRSSNPGVRDQGGLGIASLDNPSAIPEIEAAIAREVYTEIATDLTLVLTQLEETAKDNKGAHR